MDTLSNSSLTVCNALLIMLCHFGAKDVMRNREHTHKHVQEHKFYKLC